MMILLLYLALGLLIQILFEMVWYYQRLRPYPHIWVALWAGVLLWPFTLLMLLTWSVLRIRGLWIRPPKG